MEQNNRISKFDIKINSWKLASQWTQQQPERGYQHLSDVLELNKVVGMTTLTCQGPLPTSLLLIHFLCTENITQLANCSSNGLLLLDSIGRSLSFAYIYIGIEVSFINWENLGFRSVAIGQSGLRLNRRCCHVRQMVHLAHKRHSPH